MFHVVYEIGLDAWQLPYAVYVLWVSGLSVFYLTATAREPILIVERMKRSGVGVLIGFWMVSAVLAGAFAWPLLIGGPFLVLQAGAPVGAAIVLFCYFAFQFLLGGKLMMKRWPAISRF